MAISFNTVTGNQASSAVLSQINTNFSNIVTAEPQWLPEVSTYKSSITSLSSLSVGRYFCQQVKQSWEPLPTESSSNKRLFILEVNETTIDSTTKRLYRINYVDGEGSGTQFASYYNEDDNLDWKQINLESVFIITYDDEGIPNATVDDVVEAWGQGRVPVLKSDDDSKMGYLYEIPSITSSYCKFIVRQKPGTDGKEHIFIYKMTDYEVTSVIEITGTISSTWVVFEDEYDEEEEEYTGAIICSSHTYEELSALLTSPENIRAKYKDENDYTYYLNYSSYDSDNGKIVFSGTWNYYDSDESISNILTLAKIVFYEDDTVDLYKKYFDNEQNNLYSMTVTFQTSGSSLICNKTRSEINIFVSNNIGTIYAIDKDHGNIPLTLDVSTVTSSFAAFTGLYYDTTQNGYVLERITMQSSGNTRQTTPVITVS